MSCVAARLDDLPKPLWIALTILGFALWWPAGLAMLGYLLWSRKMGCWHHARRDRWDSDDIRETAERWFGGRGRGRSSGNRAFDEYRAETLKRLEEEQREFKDFLARLRFARDRAEFDQFMAERRNRPFEPDSQSQPPAPPRD